jgi:hypothetical protein
MGRGRDNVTIGHDLLRTSAPLSHHLVDVRPYRKKTQKTSTEPAMKPKTKTRPDSKRDEPTLDRRYGKIGISAVAAALPYQSNAKNPADAPVAHRDDERFGEVAA